METLVPEPIKPLGPETTDMDVIEGKDEKPQLLYETDEARILLQLVQDYEKDEEFVRLSQTLKWRKNHHYWNSLQYLALDEVAHDWRTPEEILEDDPQADIDPALYAKVVNVFKAHGEILIGALTSGTPIVRFFPKDADDPEDVTSAKAHSKLAELIQRHNKARLLLMKSLFLLYNEGLVAAYNENKSDYRFGSLKVPDYQNVEMTNRDNYCPSCGHEFGTDQFEPDELNPEGPMMSEQECPHCGMMVQPEFEDSKETVNVQVGEKYEPKNRECIEIYGPLNVKVPQWAKDQMSIPYLILETEEPVGMMRGIYSEIADKIQDSSYPDVYDKEARIPSIYRSDFPRGLCTVQRVWLRQWAFNDHTKGEEETALLKEKYKDGAYVVIINKSIVAEILPDKLDDHWTLSEHPLSEVIHAEPIGQPMVPLQDITNELTNLTLETIEFGIPETFADTRVLDFEAYPQVEARPGQISPATAPAGQNLSGGFHEIKASTLSREVDMFFDRTHNNSQFVMGSYPSIYGGPPEGSDTVGVYESAKASALQRLSTTWIILQEWWVKVMTKSVRSAAKNLREDEKYVQQKGGSFINVWVKKADLNGGEIGDVEPEISETFPISWTQKRDVILNLIQMQNEDIATVFRHPENASLIAQYIGLPELYIPGDDSRNKQLNEIAQMLMEEPFENGDGTFTSSVQVDPELDEHPVEAEVCAAWLRSEVGQDAKKNLPGGYMNVLSHYKEHKMFEQQAMMAQAPPPGQEQPEPVGEQVGA